MYTQKELIEFLKFQPVKHYKKFGDVKFIINEIDDLKVDTIIGSKLETTNTAKVGDYILTGSANEQYVVKPETFNKRYEVLNENLARPTGECFGIEYKGETLSFTSPWNEQMICEDGDMLVTPDAEFSQVYRIEKAAFKNTYKEVEK